MKTTDLETIELWIERVESARSAPLGATLEQCQSREDAIREALRNLDEEIWAARREGENHLVARERLAPGVVW